MAQTYNLGKVMVTPRGAYASSATYEPLDVVTYSGSSYLVLVETHGVVPSQTSPNYQLIAEKGRQGDPGQASTVQVGTVTIVDSPSQMSVTNSGTENAAIFDFALARGVQGLPGRPTLARTVTIPTSAWSNDTATVSVEDMTSDAVTIVTPNPASYQVASDIGIYCSAQGSGTLTFTAMNGAPSSSVTMNVLIFQ